MKRSLYIDALLSKRNQRVVATWMFLKVIEELNLAHMRHLLWNTCPAADFVDRQLEHHNA